MAVSSSVSPKGQITIPIEIREQFDIKPTDRVEFKVIDNQIVIVPTKQKLKEVYGSIPARRPPATWKEVEESIREESADNVASEDPEYFARRLG